MMLMLLMMLLMLVVDVAVGFVVVDGVVAVLL